MGMPLSLDNIANIKIDWLVAMQNVNQRSNAAQFPPTTKYCHSPH